MRSNTIIFEKIHSLTLSDLRGAGLLDRTTRTKTRVVTFKRSNGLEIDSYSITITTTLNKDDCYVDLEYYIDALPINYRIQLVKVVNKPVNSFSLYFRCAITGRICRKLYCDGKYFVHRTAINNAYYRRGTFSKSKRQGFDGMKKILMQDKLISERARKNYRTHYAGVYTAKHLRLMQAHKELKKQIAFN